MEPIRWIRGVVPIAAAALMATGSGVHPPALVAVDSPWVPPPCAEGDPPGDAGPAWYRLDGVLDDTGTLASMRLSLGLVGGTTRVVELPPESFATGPSGSRVLVGADDGTTSRLTLIDVARECSTPVGDEAAVVRSALLAPDGLSVVEHRVDRVTRADLGVWRRPVSGGRTTRIVGGVPADGRYGATFTTELRWAPDGRLAVTSCGELACRTRVIGGNGVVQVVAPTGPVLGLTSDGTVVANGICPGYPCPVLLHDRKGGMTMLVPTAGRAALAGDRLVYETVPGADADADPGDLATVDVPTGRIGRIEASSGLVPLRDGSVAGAGASHRSSAALVAPAGLLDGASVEEIDELATTAEPIGEAQ